MATTTLHRVARNLPPRWRRPGCVPVGLALPRGAFCRPASSTSESQVKEEVGSVVYEGPLAKTLIYLKRVSATTFGLSTFAAPLLTVAEYSNLAVVGTMMGAAVLTSGLSTLLVQYCVNPYVTKVILPNPPVAEGALSKGEHAILQTLTFFGNPRYTAVHVSDLIPAADRAFANWRLQEGAPSSDDRTHRELFALLPVLPSKFGRKRTRFYVHPELDQGFEPRMAELVRAVNRAGRTAVAAHEGKANNGAVNPRLQGGAMGKQDWDEIVKGLRDKK
ncbi:hypothetical protein HDU86_001073 [Geranomyces michiganensis]|nr:hypothetical protein HDU86_001073 [Geranomyces michiganensis]